MKDLMAQVVTQVRIYPPDWIPYRQLTAANGIALFKEVLAFRGTGVAGDSGDLAFEGGTLSLEGQPPIHINQVQINDRRIIVQVAGDSDGANASFAMIAKIFDGLRRVDLEESPQIVTDDTASVATFSFGWEDLISDKVAAFSKLLLEQPEFEGTSPFIKSISVRVQLGFLEKEEHKSTGISLSDKVLTLETRKDTPIRERRFYTTLPFASQKASALLGKLEASLSRPKKK